MTKNEKDYVEAGDYIEAETNASDSTIYLKTVELDGEMALINPFSSQVMDYRFNKQTTVEKMNKHLEKQERHAYPVNIQETVNVRWYIGETPIHVSLKARAEHLLKQIYLSVGNQINKIHSIYELEKLDTLPRRPDSSKKTA